MATSVNRWAGEGGRDARGSADAASEWFGLCTGSIVDTVSAALLLVDTDLRVHSTNAAFERTFQRPGGEVEGLRLVELGLPELAQPALLERLTELLGGGPAIERTRLRAPAPEELRRAFLLSARRVESLALLVLEDVSELERAAVSVRRAERRMHGIMLHASVPMLITDDGARISFVNRALAALFGYAVEELDGASLDTLVPERLRALHAAHRAGFHAPPSPQPMGWGSAVVGRRKDGSELPIEITLSPLPEADGGVVACVVDLTHRHEAERRIRAYQESLQRLTFDAARTEERERRRIALELHDRLGQSLALAQIKLTAARDATVGPSRADLSEVVDLLGQAVAETRTLTFDLSPPVLYELGLVEALAWLAEEHERRFGMTVTLAIEEGAARPMEETSRALLFRAVRELLMNVWKHAQTRSARVSMRRRAATAATPESAGDELEIDVEDSGVGFDPEQIASDRAGRGFGLLSVREQIHRMGGTMTVTSTPGHGARVVLCLPQVGAS
jgi:PAS domain S-box-containing protein